MSTFSHGTSGPSGHIGLRPPGQPAMGGNYPMPQQISPEQSISREVRTLVHSVQTLRSQLEGSSVTKREFDALAKSLDRLALGTNDGDAVQKLQSTRTDVLLTALERIKNKLQNVSDCVENASYIGNNKDAKVASQLMHEVRAAIIDCQSLALPSSLPGELPPRAPIACFGRDDLIEEIVTLADDLTPVALIGTGGIGKTSIALAMLHHDRVKQRFGEDRRFVRCDQFPATPAHLLNRLSKVIGAGIENPEDLTCLCPHLSSKEMIIVLDNAESILDPQGTDAAEIYALLEELSQLPTLCLCITSRISTIPPECETLEIPTLSMDAACRTFYRIYKHENRPDLINGILEQLDFHPLSITLLATVAHQNKWGINRLKSEWDGRRTSVLQTRHNKSLAAAIELSLASPTFQEFGPDARALLGVIAFFPQGVNENNVGWLFPTLSNGIDIFDGFCVLSLTYRSNGFITMLAPLRDYLSPADPMFSPLLYVAKGCYFTRLSVEPDPNKPDFGEGRWITSEDINVEHLLDVFTTIDADSDDIWDACINFLRHLYWHKKRLTVLNPKIEGLPDDHRWKPICLSELSQLFDSLGDQVERKRLLIHTLKLETERGNGFGVVQTLWRLSDADRQMGLLNEGIQLAKGALQILEPLGDVVRQVQCLIKLAWSLRCDNQLDAAEEAASRAIDLLSEKGNQFLVYDSHLVLGKIYRSKDDTEKAVHHFEVALRIASSFGWHDQQFWAHHSLAWLFLDEARFDNAQAHVGRAKAYAVDYPYLLGLAMELQVLVWFKQGRLEEARSEALRAADVFEKLGGRVGMERRGVLLEITQQELNSPVVSGLSGSISSQGTE